jgi:polyhydroxyalkanoate synthase
VLNAIKTLTEQAVTRLKYGPEFIGDPKKIETGLTPRQLVMKDRNHCLYFYPGKKEKNEPLLLIYSLINRPYIFDLRPGRSMIEFLCSQGYDIYLVDWDDATPESALLTLDDLLAGTLHRFTRWVLRKHRAEKLNILGYCMGATFAVMYAALYPELVKKLVLLTPPLGNEAGGILQKIASSICWENKIAGSGIISGRMLKQLFNSVRPAGAIKKERDFWLNYDRENYLENFLPVEKWSNDSPDLPGKIFFEFLDICFRKDLLNTGKFSTGNSHIDLNRVTCPVFSVAARHDWIIPVSALNTVQKVLPAASHRSFEVPGGHIGLVIGKSAGLMWNEMLDFLD